MTFTPNKVKGTRLALPKEEISRFHREESALFSNPLIQLKFPDFLLILTLFGMGGGGHDGPPKMFLTTVLKRFGGGSWNLVTFNINLWGIKKSYFWFVRLSSVTMATSLSGGTRDLLKISFHMFPCNEILKVFKSKIWRKHLKIPLNTKFQRNQSGGLEVTSIWNLGQCVGWNKVMTS